jgi:hypothetical protein
MRKHKVAHRPQTTGPALKTAVPEHDLPWAHDMAGHAMDMSHQLETVARRLSGMPGESEQEQTDLPNVMGLFAENLAQVSALLEEVRMVMEDTDPTILNAAHG